MNSSQHNDQKGVMNSLQPCSNSDSTSLADALHKAASNGDQQQAQTLLAAGAAVNEAAPATGDTPLFAAATAGHADVVQLLLRAGADMWASSSGATPLYAAVVCGHVAVAKLLLNAGADLRAWPAAALTDYQPSGTPCQVAAVWGHVSMLQLLLLQPYCDQLEVSRTSLEQAADVAAAMDMPVCLAARNGHTAAVQVLLDSKVTGPSSRMVLERGSTLYSLIRWNDTGMAQLLLGSATSSARSSALYEAAKRKDTAVVKTLLDAGVGDTPYQFALQVAAEQAAPELVRLLLDAAPSVQPAQPGTVGDGSNLQPFAVGMGFALLWAVSAGRAESVRLLLQAGAPTGPMLPEGGGNDVPPHVACIPGQRHWTQAALGLRTPEGCKLPLHVAVKQAVRSGDMSLVCLLLAAGADVNAADRLGWTALHIAACTFHAQHTVPVVQVLLAAGADVARVTAASRNCKTALMLAADRGSLVVVDCLLAQSSSKMMQVADLIATAMMAASTPYAYKHPEQLAVVQALLNAAARDVPGTRAALDQQISQQPDGVNRGWEILAVSALQGWIEARRVDVDGERTLINRVVGTVAPCLGS